MNVIRHHHVATHEPSISLAPSTEYCFAGILDTENRLSLVRASSNEDDDGTIENFSCREVNW